MAKYLVRLYYHSFIDVEVEAENETDAIDAAHCEADQDKYTDELLENLIEDDSPDVEEV